MKIVPYNYLDDLEKEEAVGIESMSITYIQPADTCSDRDEEQVLKIELQSGVSYDKETFEQGKEGFYFDVSLPEGGHWPVDSGDQLAALIDDFKERLYKKTLTEKEDQNV